jgi:hypothetical protein
VVSRRSSALWGVRVVTVLVAAVTVNLSLSALEIEHDAPLVALLILTAAAAALLALEALDASVRLPWTLPRPDAQPGPGEDTRTTSLRHLVEAHQTSHQADDAVLWQLADLASRRLRQVHGIRYADDPDRVRELLGPVLAELVSRDRRHRYDPAHHHRRYTVAELGELLHRIEDL